MQMKDIHKVALVFDDRTRPETTGVYCRRALESLVDVAFCHPDQLAEIPCHGFGEEALCWDAMPENMRKTR